MEKVDGEALAAKLHKKDQEVIPDWQTVLFQWSHKPTIKFHLCVF